MKWLVTINNEGTQCQFLLGKDVSKSAEKEKSIKKQIKIKYIFEIGKNPNSNDYQERKEYGDYLLKRINDFYKEENAWGTSEKFGYEFRKRHLTGTEAIEVLADLDANNYEEFRKKYRGDKGAVKILDAAEKLMSPKVDSPESAIKKINKLKRQLAIASEDD